MVELLASYLRRCESTGDTACGQWRVQHRSLLHDACRSMERSGLAVGDAKQVASTAEEKQRQENEERLPARLSFCGMDGTELSFLDEAAVTTKPLAARCLRTGVRRAAAVLEARQRRAREAVRGDDEADGRPTSSPSSPRLRCEEGALALRRQRRRIGGKEAEERARIEAEERARKRSVVRRGSGPSRRAERGWRRQPRRAPRASAGPVSASINSVSYRPRRRHKTSFSKDQALADAPVSW